MKKLFYIILVVVVLVLVGKFVKEKQAETPVVESVTITEEENVVSPDTVIVPDQDVQAVDEIDETVVETNQFDGGDGMVVDEATAPATDEVVEENPEFTSGDDETIVAE